MSVGERSPATRRSAETQLRQRVAVARQTVAVCPRNVAPRGAWTVALTMHKPRKEVPMLSACTYRRLAAADPTSPVSTPTRIVIADDDPETLEFMHLAVHAPGVEIYVAMDGLELLELIADCEPLDLIVTDINMPLLEGLQVLASIREAGLATPVVVVTGLDRPTLPTTIARLGNAMLLRKPFDVADLRRAIAALLANES
jgi:CheY-like chemotaxis protein